MWHATEEKLAPDMTRTIYDIDHDLFRESVRQFIEQEIAPHDVDSADRGLVDRSLFRAAGDAGMLLFATLSSLAARA